MNKEVKVEQLTKEKAIDVLTAWSAIEVLSPQKFLRPADLIGGDSSSVAIFDHNFLPWENGGERAKPKTQLFYQVILGTVDLEQALQALSVRYSIDNTGEFARLQGQSILALCIVDQRGYLISDKMAVNISSFAWGIRRALDGNLKGLSDWLTFQEEITNKLKSILQKKDEQENDLPLTKATLDEAYNNLIDTFDIPTKMVINKRFGIRSYGSLQKDYVPSPLLLNSFYLKDLARARFFVKTDSATENLKKYLGMRRAKNRVNILDNNRILEGLVAPKNIYPSRWPGSGRYPLVLLQQAAVNLSLSELDKGGIIAINGPPGTGKSTLLRDVVAGVVTKRAEAFLAFDNPASAFKSTEHKIELGKHWLRLYQLDPALKGFEILIASSNNKAVENVSAELPSLSAIASDAHDLRYFSALSNALLGRQTWGLIAAVLGNSGNRNHFRKKFWWDEDVGFSTYLAEAAGIPQKIEYQDIETGKTLLRSPKIIEENDPPRNHDQALERWKKARDDFKRVFKECKEKLNVLEKIREAVHRFERLEGNADLKSKILANQIHDHLKCKPNIIKRMLGCPCVSVWKTEERRLADTHTLVKHIEDISETFEGHLVNRQLFSKDRSEVNQISPWCDAVIQNMRDEVFIASIKLSKAFIDAAALPLRHNLGILMNFFGKQSKQVKSVILQFMSELWSSLFLVVPCVSTTFASVGNMLESYEHDSLGWLFIDEAGQATPQAAVGAIMRTKRAVIVGDPLQIEPIVSLPQTLTDNICQQFGVNTNRFNAPQASAQTLADDATSHFAEIQNKNGSRVIGFPLLVHRRCADPMFSISNAIAYERLMVQAKKHKESLICKHLGESTWFDIRGQAQEKWCFEEGEKVVELLNRLKEAGVIPDLYIITPFKVVANQLRKMLLERGVMQGWFGMDPYHWVYKQVGTVHTVQGGEAEGVILVLGAPGSEQKGARDWAGGAPNLLNVAITRAREVVYVVGNQMLWKEAGVFKELYNRIVHS